MNKTKVRCWKVIDYHPGNKIEDELFVTYPASHMGHDLITCLKCGSIYAANVSSQMYDKPLEKKLESINCAKCHAKLKDNYAIYPDKYLSKDGTVHAFIKDDEIPNAETSLVREFLEIYS